MNSGFWLYVALSYVMSLMVGFMFIRRISAYCLKHKLYDIPNERKIHHNAIPRLGGVAFIPCMFVAFLVSLYVFKCITGNTPFTISLWTFSFLVSLFIIYIVGGVDDIIGLGAPVKFSVQIVAASLLPVCGLYINSLYGFCGIYELPFWVGAPLTVLVIVFIDNAMNLIDGIDGLSGGLALMSLAGFLVCFGRAGVWTYCVLIAGLMGVITAYLYFNIFGSPEKGSKVFMGDSGSLTLGFILGFLAVKYSMDGVGNLPRHDDGLLLSYTLLIVPCFDVVRVVLSRLRSRQPLFKADKRHIHHKLLRCGLSQHQALAKIIALQIVFVIANLLMFPAVHITFVVIVDVAIYTLFHLILNCFIRRKEHEASVG